MTPSLMPRRPLLIIALCLAAVSVQGGELHIDSDEDWARWSRPEDVIDIDQGSVKPAFTHKSINAVANAPLFGGGIRGAGTDLTNAANLIDSDPSTCWSPDFSEPVTSWWIEIDLGRVVSASELQLRFAAKSQPLSFFEILTSAGEYIPTSSEQQTPDAVIYNRVYKYGFNEKHLITVDLDLTPIRYIRIQAKRKNLDVQPCELTVEAVGDNLSLGIDRRDGTIFASDGTKSSGDFLETGISRNSLVDGDFATAWLVGDSSGETLIKPLFGQIDLDLGAVFWVDHVRLLGRESRQTLPYIWHQLYGSEGSLAPDGSLRWALLSELSAASYSPSAVDCDIPFPLQRIRFLRFLFPLSDGLVRLKGRLAIAEFQTFGEGFPPELAIRSPIYDLGGVKNVTAVEWLSEEPLGTSLELASRSGNLLQERIVYRNKDGREVTYRQWDRLIPSMRGLVDTLYNGVGEDWTGWSRPYSISGQSYLSANPRRYLQLEARLLSDDPFKAASLNAITLRFDDPLVQQTQGEIFPRKTLPGIPTDFTYYLSNTFTRNNTGFDRISIRAAADIEFRCMRIDGAQVDVDVEPAETGIHILLDRAVTQNSLIEIDFQATLFQQTSFEAYLSHAENRQIVDPGDATPSVASEQVVVSLASTNRLIDQVKLSSPIISPNRDGIRDRLGIEFDLLELSEWRPVEIAVFTLTGRRIRTLAQTRLTAGRQSIEWDGRSAEGLLVPPGLYVLRIAVEGDGKNDSINRLITVVY